MSAAVQVSEPFSEIEREIRKLESLLTQKALAQARLPDAQSDDGIPRKEEISCESSLFLRSLVAFEQ